MEHKMITEDMLFSHKDYLSTIFHRVSHLCELKQNAILKRYKVTHQQTRLLAFIYARDGKEVYQRDIEKAFYLKSSTVTETLNILEKDGFIERLPCPHDKRAKLLKVTKKAADLHEDFLDSILQVEAVVKHNLSTQEQESFHNTLLKIYENLEHSLVDSQ